MGTNYAAMQYTMPAINILTDILVWAAPLKLIWIIQLPRRQEAGLVAAFSIGGLQVPVHGGYV